MLTLSCNFPSSIGLIITVFVFVFTGVVEESPGESQVISTCGLATLSTGWKPNSSLMGDCTTPLSEIAQYTLALKLVCRRWVGLGRTVIG